MPIRIAESMPAHDILESENIFVMTERRAMSQDIRPLKVLILNLMPTKIVTRRSFSGSFPTRPCRSTWSFCRRQAIRRLIRTRGI